jgi:hypothetical protein
MGDGVLQQGRQLQQSDAVQDASRKAAGTAKAAASRLAEQWQELASSEAVQGLRQSAGKAVSGLRPAAAGRGEPQASPAAAQRNAGFTDS